MAVDPSNPPIWLCKLHLVAAQITPDQYARTPEEGVLRGCRLSDALLKWSQACAQALALPAQRARAPFDNPFRLTAGIAPLQPRPQPGDVPR